MPAAKQSQSSLQDLLDSKSDLVDYLYNETKGPHSRGKPGASPVPPEFSNWRDEQRAWRNAAILFDQSHHMPELFLKGPDAFRLLNTVGINTFNNFVPGRAKQFVGCNPHGQVIGDCILHYLAPESFELISGMPLLNWVHFQAETGDYDVSVVRENATASNPTGRRINFRFGMDGPHAWAIFKKAAQQDLPDIPFFRTARLKVAGHDVLILRHGMAGHHGVEVSGAYENGPAVHAALLKAGIQFGLRQGGTRAYFSTAVESAWIPYPLPAIYTSPELEAFRRWLPADAWESQFQLGGSFRSSRLDDYYSTPWDLGYEKLIKFDHDFIGRQALEAMPAQNKRKRVTLVWNQEDFQKVVGSMYETGLQYKAIDFPVADYAFPQRDEVRSEDGRFVGLSGLCGYSINEARMLSLGMLNADEAIEGKEVLITWGEPDGGSRKPHVERHKQTTIRAIIGPAPYAQPVRAMKNAGQGELR